MMQCIVSEVCVKLRILISIAIVVDDIYEKLLTSRLLTLATV